MRLALLGFLHETNTFAARPTDYAQFAQGGILRGEEIVRRHREAYSSLAGYLEAGERPGVEVVPLYAATTEPSGLITSETFERIAEEMLHVLEQQGPWDGVLLALHGAAVSAAYPDADGELIARVRRLVGPATPIALTLDLHANLSPQMVEQVTVTVLYRTNPHLDARPRARQCAELLIGAVRGEWQPVQALEQPPLLINIVKQSTDEEPMRSLMRAAAELERQPGMLSTSIAEGYPYADVPEMGMAFLAIHNGDRAAAQVAARRLALAAWQQREQFTATISTPREALQAAMVAPRGPVVLLDVGDNIPGGSPGDSTVLLAEARRLGIPDYLQTLYDPEAVTTCVAGGVGAELRLPVGGKAPDSPALPVLLSGRVRLLSDGRFADAQPTHGGARYFDAGPTAVLESEHGCTLVLTSRRIGNTSIQQMYALGIRPEAKRVVVAKGVISPRPAYAPIAAQMIMVNTPGVTTADLSRFHYQHRRRPLYPFDPEARYEAFPDADGPA